MTIQIYLWEILFAGCVASVFYAAVVLFPIKRALLREHGLTSNNELLELARSGNSTAQNLRDRGNLVLVIAVILGIAAVILRSFTEFA